MNFSRKSMAKKGANLLLLVLLYCCAISCAADSNLGRPENKVGSLSKERVNAKDALMVNKRSNLHSDVLTNALEYASPLELEKARQFCQQLISAAYSRPVSSENGPNIMAILNGGPVRESAQKISLEERRNQINTSSLCRAMLHFTSKEEGEKVQGHKQSKRSADYDYSGESDTLSKKLDYLFANEGIRFKRNQNATSGSGSSYLVRLYVPPSTTKPGILQQLSRHLGSTVAFSPMATTTASFGTSATSSLSPTSATPRLAQSSSSSGTSSTHSAHPMPRRPTLIGQLLMLHRFGELNNRDYAPTKWMLYNNHDQGSSSLPLVESNLELFNSAEQLQPTRILVKNLVKKNPFDKEGIRFKRGLETDAEVGSFELSNNGYPFVNEGIRFKKSPFDDEGIRYKKSSPFAEEGIRYKKSPFDEEGIRYKKSSPFAEEGIRYKKSPFDAEGIRFKKSPFDAEGIRFKKSPFDEEGIRYKKSPFDEEGIRY